MGEPCGGLFAAIGRAISPMLKMAREAELRGSTGFFCVVDGAESATGHERGPGHGKNTTPGIRHFYSLCADNGVIVKKWPAAQTARGTPSNRRTAPSESPKPSCLLSCLYGPTWEVACAIASGSRQVHHIVRRIHVLRYINSTKAPSRFCSAWMQNTTQTAFNHDF